MSFAETFAARPAFLMEGAVGTRLRGEYGLLPDPCIALATHMYDATARAALTDIYDGYMRSAGEYGLPFLANTHTRRVNRERLAASQYGEAVFADSVSFLRDVCGSASIGATVGCQGDAYTGVGALDGEAALAYYDWTVTRFARAGADFIFAALIPTLSEAEGVARACSELAFPCVISFTIRPDGRLPDGTGLDEAIRRVDDAVARPPLCYMANCLHPDRLARALDAPQNRSAAVQARFMGIQANAADLSHAELDAAETVVKGDAWELAQAIGKLRGRISLKIAGRCCGTDDESVREIARMLACADRDG